jgi:ATP synthase F1, gamma subunit
MASLKEVKGRILSANNTLKITSAMKMVASAKLHKAQEVIEGMLPYERQMSAIMTHFLQTGGKTESPFATQREAKRIALVIFSSNSSLCGGFNSNVIRSYHQWLDEHAQMAKENLIIYPVGRKIADAVKKSGFTPAGDYTHMADKPNYTECESLATELCERFLSGDIDRVELIYHHFKSAGSQELVNTVYLPIDLSAMTEVPTDNRQPDYLIEPSEEILLAKLIPEVLKLKVYTTLLDSNASEHATRSMAMQIATDNANNLIQDLTVVYNKGRQQAITNELLDIMGGTMA